MISFDDQLEAAREGNVVMNQPRHVVLVETFTISHTIAASSLCNCGSRPAGARDLRPVRRRPQFA